MRYNNSISRKFVPLALGVISLMAAGSAFAQKVSVQFSQVFPNGGQIDGYFIGEDLDGDGRLYSMASFFGDVLNLPAGDEVEYISLHFRHFNGASFTQVFDRSIVGIEDPSNVFMALAYNLDGGALGDDANEGMSFGPLAPSTSYIMGPLFTPPSSGGVEPFAACGNDEGLPCAEVVTLLPVDPFPDFEITFATASAAAVPTTNQLRFRFRQSGFPDGGVISGVISGRDSNGDGRLTTVTPLISNFFQLDLADEVDHLEISFGRFNNQSSTVGIDRTVSAFDDPSIAFTFADFDLTGQFVGDEEGEIIVHGPPAPSTSWQLGNVIPHAQTIPDQLDGLCGNAEGLACAFVATVTPSETLPPPAIDVLFSDSSNQPVEMVPAPIVADGEYSGSWYAPSNDGEGFEVQALADGRMLVYWYTYDGEGNQRWFVGTGRREGLTLLVDELLVTQGGIFGPNFDPATVARDPAGSLRFEFTSCNSATASYTIDGSNGSQELIRLTQLSGQPCRSAAGTSRIDG